MLRKFEMTFCQENTAFRTGEKKYPLSVLPSVNKEGGFGETTFFAAYVRLPRIMKYRKMTRNEQQSDVRAPCQRNKEKHTLKNAINSMYQTRGTNY